jgi:aminoglycoside phosphotransferase (APT) family kinase protein
MLSRVADELLPGGFVSAVVRVGETVRRPAAPEFVRRLLVFLEERGWAGAPRWLGVDGRGRDVLSYLDGDVPWQPERHGEVRTDAALTRVAGLVRELHDLTAGTELAGGGEVVCHNDLSPKNTVYRDDGRGLVPVAFLDWDIAAPGRRVHDVAHVCWQYVGLGPAADPDRAAAGVRLVADAYGLDERDELVATVLWWQDRCWRGIAAKAAAGEPAMIRLREAGVVEQVRTDHDWTAAHRPTLEHALH